MQVLGLYRVFDVNNKTGELDGLKSSITSYYSDHIINIMTLSEGKPRGIYIRC